jgi:molecular chaperone DnaK (HSP70)
MVSSDMKVKPKIIVNGNGNEEKLKAEKVVSLLFGQLKEITENYLGAKVTNAVVTVPTRR